MGNVFVQLDVIDCLFVSFDVFTYLLEKSVESIGRPFMFMLCIYFEKISAYILCEMCCWKCITEVIEKIN